MSPKVRFRRGLLKCLYSQYCHSEFLKKSADWYFGKTYLSFYCNLRKLKSIITELWRLSVVFLCYFMAHEHLLKEHTYLHVASGDTPILEYRRLRSYISKLVTSRFFQKWCSSGVVSALLLQRTTDFTGFFRTFRDIAVAHEKYFYHLFITPHKFYISSQMLDITGFFTLYTLSVLSPVLKII